MDDSSRKIVLKYLLQVADVLEPELIEAAYECLPKDREMIMTVAEQLVQKGMQQGMREGVQYAEQQKREIVQNLLQKGIDVSVIAEATELDITVVLQIKKQMMN